MKKKAAPGYVCTECGARTIKWAGRCPECRGWGTLAEVAPVDGGASWSGTPAGVEPQLLSAVEVEEGARLSTGIAELDRVLGGGVVPGSAVLVGGRPGIGKSTLLLQTLGGLASGAGVKVLYVSGEESPRQLRMRAGRIGVDSAAVYVLSASEVGLICEKIVTLSPAVVVVDSIQTTYDPSLGGGPGGPVQVRECAARLVRTAKASDTALFLVGHLTKDGSIAGPRTLEHLVDTVLYFEGDGGEHFRLLRATKNRFGSTDELGVFEMTASGLRSVEGELRMFLGGGGEAAGSVVVPCLEGTRPLLVEIQALCARSRYPTPERRVSGLDRNRLCMLLAVLERRGGLDVGAQDVFVNVVGGLRVDDTASDLGVAMAVASSFLDVPLGTGTVVLGEVGLGGEIRTVPRTADRLKEAVRLGFTRAVLPEDAPVAAGVSAVRVKELKDALGALVPATA